MMRSAYITVLLVATCLLILTASLMALLIGLVLPKHMLEENGNDMMGNEPEEIPLELERRNFYRSYGNINDHNYLVSINFLRYRDIPTSLEFACCGVIISRNKILTGNGCLRERFVEEDFKYATIRSHSAFFSREGYTHSIRTVLKSKNNLKPPYNEIYLIEVKPSFSSKTNIPMLITTYGAHIALEAMSEGGAIVLAGWGGTLVPTDYILKFEPFFVQRWYPTEYIDCKERLCNELRSTATMCCNEAVLVEDYNETRRINARPLIAIRRLGPPLLLGMQTDHPVLSDKTPIRYILDFGYPNFVEWLKETLPDLLVEETSRGKHDFEPLFLYHKIDYDAFDSEKKVYNMKMNSKRITREIGGKFNISKGPFHNSWSYKSTLT